MKAVGFKVSSGSFSGGQAVHPGPERSLALRNHIAKRREMRENSDAVRQFRRMRLFSELRAAHLKMEEPKTLEQLIAEDAREKLEKAKTLLSGLTLPA